MKIIGQLVEESSNMDGELAKQKHIIYEASSSFSEIALLVNEITPKVSNIDSAFKDIGYNKDLIVGTVCELSEEVKNTSNSLELVADSSIELAKFAESVNGSADVLLDKADELIEKVRQFRIEKEDSLYEGSLIVNGKKSKEVETKFIDKQEMRLENLNTEKLPQEQDELNEIYIVDLENDSKELDGIRELDLALVEELRDLAKPSKEEMQLEEDMPTKDFGWGCNKVTEIKEYAKEREINERMERELEYKELGVYNAARIM